MIKSIIEQIRQSLHPLAGGGYDAMSFAEFEGIVNECIKARQEFVDVLKAKGGMGPSLRIGDLKGMKDIMTTAEYDMAIRASRVARDFVDEAIEATVTFGADKWASAIVSYQQATNSFKRATWFLNKIPDPDKEPK